MFLNNPFAHSISVAHEIDEMFMNVGAHREFSSYFGMPGLPCEDEAGQPPAFRWDLLHQILHHQLEVSAGHVIIVIMIDIQRVSLTVTCAGEVGGLLNERVPTRTCAGSGLPAC